MSEQERLFSPAFVQEQELNHVQHQAFHTEVLDAHPYITMPTIDHLEDRYAVDPGTLKIVVFNSEPGNQKGTYLGQLGQQLLQLREQQLQIYPGKTPVRLHYFSSALMVKAGIEKGLQSSAYGAPTPDEIAAITAMTDKRMQVAEEHIPEEEPNAVHILLEEFAGVTERFDVGASLVKRQGKDEDTFVVFLVTSPEIQHRAERLRRKLADNSSDHTLALRRAATVFDMDASEAIYTMGTSDSIRLVTDAVNESMLEVWIDGNLQLPTDGPNKVPWEILREYDPAKIPPGKLEKYFRELTRWTSRGMRTHPIRPYLQVGYYEHLIEKWDIKNAIITMPQFVEGEIHAYMSFLAEHAVDIGKYPDAADSLTAQQIKPGEEYDLAFPIIT